MRRTTLAVLAALATLAHAPASAQTPGAYVDPGLRALARPALRATVEQLERAAPGAPSTPPAVRGNLAIEPLSGSPVSVGIFLEARDDGAADVVRSLGGTVEASVGRLLAASIPLAAIDALSRSGHFVRIEAAHAVKVVDDSSSSAIDVGNVREPVQTGWIGFGGKGSIVGIYDTGIDLRHPDFIDPAGRSRVLRLWDQTAGGSTPGVGKGLVCDSAAIAAAIADAGGCIERDLAGHGTHVAGIAAGDGSAGATAGSGFRPFAGVAPEADLLIVKGGNGFFLEQDIISGLKWIKDRAQERGRPAAVNLSLGGQSGPRDGTRVYEQILDSLSGPGFIVAVAAGNEGDNQNTVPSIEPHRFHARLVPANGALKSATLVVPGYQPSTQPCADFAVLEMWYGGADSLEVVVTRPDGTTFGVQPGDTASDNALSGGVYIDNASEGLDPANGDRQAFVEISGCGAGSGSPRAGGWGIGVRALRAPSGEAADMWILGSALGISSSARGGQGFDNRSTVGSPGTAREAVTVGSFVSRICFPSIVGGDACSTVSAPIGDIADYSSTGPTRDGRLKPEIAAPGSLILSSLSRNANFPQIQITPDNAHAALQGTSMATPHVTGALAILMQVDPSLTPDEAKAVFSRSARRDAFVQNSHVDGDPGGVPNFNWGWGKLDVQNALADLGADAGAATLAVTAQPITPADGSSSAAGTRLPLIRLGLAASGPEGVVVYQLGFLVDGSDPQARVGVGLDENGDGSLTGQEPILGTSAAAGDVGSRAVTVDVDSLLVPRSGSLNLVAFVEMGGGGAPNGSTVRLTYDPAGLRSAGEESKVAWMTRQPPAPVASLPVRTTVLRGDEVFAMSENPIRSARVVFSFKSRPTRAAIYTLAGRRVVDLTHGMSTDFRAVWTLTNDGDRPVAPGVYLLVVEVEGRRITQKLIVTGERSAVAPSGEE